ncbi:MAG: DMT family transporter [Hyphomicrobiaceae bacterium]
MPEGTGEKEAGFSRGKPRSGLLTRLAGLAPAVAFRRRWDAMAPDARGAMLVGIGSFTLVIMATLVKDLGGRLSSFEILFFRSAVGFLFVLPLFAGNPFEPLRTRRPWMHLLRGSTGAVGNACFFWTITHLLLADAMALQFSRPLFMIPLAALLLGEIAGWRRTSVSLIGFVGILLYARPFTEGFDPGVFVGALGALAGGLVVIWIKKLATTEPTRVIMFYYAFWNAVFSLLPALYLWITPTGGELLLLILVGFLGILGQGLITHGFTMGDATALIPLDYFRIVYSAILAYLLFGEVPGIWSYAGMALIVSSSLYLVLTEKRNARSG